MRGKVAIVGAGPAGCFVAQSLLKDAPALEIALIDCLPTPYGLIRYGVAPDHQGTKAITRQFSRIFERQGARFFGNVHIGRDLSLDMLRDAYDAVVLAAGLSQDRRLGIAGDDLPGVYGAGSLIRSLQSHPFADPLPALGPNPLIVGNGNVAIDLLRLLSKSPRELAGSDLGAEATAWLAGNGFRSITVLGRSPGAKAKFDPLMIRELANLSRVRISLTDPGQADGDDEQKRIDALAGIDGIGSGPIEVKFCFSRVPLSVEGADHVTGLRVASPQGEKIIEASSIVTAVGFASNGELGASETDGAAGKPGSRLYSAGWFGHGPKGAIPDARLSAQTIAAQVLGELAADNRRIGSAIFENLPDVVDYAGWQRIEAAELLGRNDERCRAKLQSIDAMLQAARSNHAGSGEAGL
ncbi:FAD-dependent oxidoreductase [Neorhizobium alkalisoli]|uniref:Ferredoxin--NADP+ reductase n=1 Tax=Neorhizobium alkalisoli TaxID=528178 RepID=A0A561R8T8_9HYPH|nr:FAD-dependent oxidoreductase [Neorhizobium alkalisoli]TWF59052.1 ferredoxin--NADP+ reductase [Neorhizobium alkalisoli]